MLHLTLLTFMQLAQDGEKFGGTTKARQDFPHSITADSIKELGQVYESCISTQVLFSAFVLYLPSTKIMSVVPLFDLNPHWLSGVFSCPIVWMSLFSKTRTKIWPAMECRVMHR